MEPVNKLLKAAEDYEAGRISAAEFVSIVNEFEKNGAGFAGEDFVTLEEYLKRWFSFTELDFFLSTYGSALNGLVKRKEYFVTELLINRELSVHEEIKRKLSSLNTGQYTVEELEAFLKALDSLKK